MAPQQHERRHRSRPSSGAPASPSKSSPRKSGEKRHSRDPERERKRASQSPEKRRSRHDGEERGERVRTREEVEQVREKRRSRGADGGGIPRKPRKDSPKKKRDADVIVVEEYGSSVSGSGGGALSMDALNKLNAMNTKDGEKERRRMEKERERERDKEKVVTGRVMKERHKQRTRRRESDGGEKVRHRVVSGNTLERGLHERGGFMKEASPKKKKIICGIILLVVVLIIVIPVAVVVSKNKGDSGEGSGDSSSSKAPGNGNLDDIDPSSIPSSAKGGYLDPFTWYDTEDFNLTYTDETVGGLPVMGLKSEWDDSTRANKYVPPLDEEFKYGQMPIRGVNVGGWLALEPFISPSMFDYDSKQGVIDEYTLTKHLGPSAAAKTLEKHYSSFINKQSFKDIQDAGFDHVRIPFSYWAWKTFEGDPYVPKISWRYLLRGIEYARECGLRVNLDPHGIPGSQNGWNHSGRQGAIGWLNGTDGAVNSQRSLDMHEALSTFFAQPRYKNVVGIYGLANEPKMISLVTADVLEWTKKAVDVVRKNGITTWIAFGDGFLGIPNWKGKLQGIDKLLLDAHMYTIFNTDQLAFDHKAKLDYACDGWSGQFKTSMDTTTGFGPTICGEWSQADTDCAPNLNNYGTGSRWTGTLNLPDVGQSVTKPACPTQDDKCSCAGANADPSEYTTEYKQWLKFNAEAQMKSYEVGLGWFYWTWRTEKATQWSYKLGMEAGILPKKVWEREFNCTGDTPAFNGLPETY